MPRLSSCQGIRALVTGASSGIGELLARRLAREGAHVALLARRSDRLEEIAREIRDAGGRALVIACDVADPAQVEAAAARARAELGGVDLLVNNAGYGHHRRFAEWDAGDMARMMRVNYDGALFASKALLPDMLARRRGWIVFVTSVAGHISVPDESAYCASKFALLGLARALSLEVEGQGVHVLAVCPGAIRTPFFDAEALARMPLAARRTMAGPEGLVDAILDALARGKREIVYPRWLRVGILVQALAPGFMRRMVARSTRRPDTSA
jgi:short-subunit dehydrogenase